MEDMNSRPRREDLTTYRAADPIAPLAELMAPYVSWWRGLIDDHQPDSYGCCSGCPHRVNFDRPRWPCTLHALGDAARLVHERRVVPDRRRR